MRPAPSLKRRVALALVTLVALFVSLQAVVSIWALHSQEDDLADDAVAQESRRLVERLAPATDLSQRVPALQLSTSYRAWWIDARGQAWPGDLPAELARLSDGPHRLEGGLGEEHVVIRPLGAGRLVLRYDASRTEAQVAQQTAVQGLLALFAVALAVLLAREVAGHTVAPLERVTRRLERWAPAPAPGADGNEEARLVAAFERVQARLEQGVTREHELLANLRHELRTPLTALRTDLELLAEPPHDPATQARRLARATAAVDQLARVLTEATALAAPPAARSRSAVALAACVADALDSLGDAPAQRQLTLDNQVPPDALVLADRHALMTILRNLLRNAVEHAAPCRCQVHLEDGQVVVEDDGPGMVPADLPLVFERYYRGRLRDAPAVADAPPADGRGLGLAIARQVAEQQGWRLRAEAVAPHGSRFVLDLRTL